MFQRMKSRIAKKDKAVNKAANESCIKKKSRRARKEKRMMEIGASLGVIAAAIGSMVVFLVAVSKYNKSKTGVINTNRQSKYTTADRGLLNLICALAKLLDAVK